MDALLLSCIAACCSHIALVWIAACCSHFAVVWVFSFGPSCETTASDGDTQLSCLGHDGPTSRNGGEGKTGAQVATTVAHQQLHDLAVHVQCLCVGLGLCSSHQSKGTTKSLICA